MKKKIMKNMSQTPILLKAKIFACPVDGCRKKMASIRDLNSHLTKKHNAGFKIELNHSEHAIIVTT